MPASSESPTRRLRAVWFADIVGYAALASNDEEKALTAVAILQKVAREGIETSGGEIVKFLGDGVLAVFGSTRSALHSALELRDAFSDASAGCGEELHLRIGVHVGDLSSGADGDIYGDGVNVASRIQTNVGPNVVGVSEDVWRQLRSRREFCFTSLGEVRFKGFGYATMLFSAGLAGDATAPENDPTVRTAIAQRKRRRTVEWAVACLIGLLAITGVAVALARVGDAAPAEVTGAALSPDATEQRSVAVLPFVNLSRDQEDEYFSDGLTDELIVSLAGVPGLRVAARTSAFAFKDDDLDVRQVGDSLSVDVIVEGSVRRDDDRLRVSVQLIDVASGYHLWSESYDRRRGDVFDIQADIARTIVDALAIELDVVDVRSLASRGTDDVEAHQAYLRGLYEQRRDVAEAFLPSRDHFLLAVELDPSYAAAWAGLAGSLVGLGNYRVLPARDVFPDAESAARRALALDELSHEAHFSMAWVQMSYRRDWTAAEREFRRAIALRPDYADGHYGLAYWLQAMGRTAEAVASARRARDLEPLAAKYADTLGRMLMLHRRYAEAAAQFERAHQLFGGSRDSRLWWPAVELLRGGDEAAHRLLATLRPELERRDAYAQLALIEALVGREAEARALLRRAEQRSLSSNAGSGIIALGYAQLGDADHAFALLDRAYDQYDSFLFQLNGPLWDPIRQDPRFAALLQRLGLS